MDKGCEEKVPICAVDFCKIDNSIHVPTKFSTINTLVMLANIFYLRQPQIRWQ